jgi:hypothetical protein
MVGHVYNPSTQEARQEDHEFEARLGSILRHCLKKQNNNNKKEKT